MLSYFPKYFTSRAVYTYVGSMLIVMVLFMTNAMPWYWYLFGFIEVTGFFYFAQVLPIRWKDLSSRRFMKRIFWTTVFWRMAYVVFLYFFFDYMNGHPYEFGESLDSYPYFVEAKWLAEMMRQGDFSGYVRYMAFKPGVSDLGYPVILALLCFLTNDLEIAPRIINVLLSGVMVLLIYKLGKRNFGESTGRMGAILTMLMPTLFFYTGLTMKEIIMTFLVVWFVERADYILRARKIELGQMFLLAIIGLLMFFFRTVLGAVAVLALYAAIIFGKTIFLNTSSKVLMGMLMGVLLILIINGTIRTELTDTIEAKLTTGTNENFEYRAKREGGNVFAERLSQAIFAPLIFSIPFPTVVNIPTQQNQMMTHGGNFDKNIMAFFTVMAVILLFKLRKWKEHVMLLAFTLGYLVVIALSQFAHAGRFHVPVLPFSMLLAAYGISMMVPRYKQLYIGYLVLEFFFIIGWSWFKLAGRGLI